MVGTACRKALILPIALATMLLLPGLAGAQSTAPSGPSSVERAVTLASPAVVFIDTSVKVHVRLIYSNPNSVSGLGHLDKTYAFDYATGSGFVVTPTGAVVTASHVVEPEEKSIRNYAANKLVLEGFGYSYPSQNSSPFEQYTLPVRYQNLLLQQCYKAVACDFTITPLLTVYSALDIAQSQLPKGAPARVLTSTGFANTDVAVLQMNGTNMPTAQLAESAGNLATGDEVVALGFPGSSRDALQTGVTQPNKVFGRVSNIRPQGTSNLIEVDANIEPGMSGGPVVDDSGRVVGLISFALIQSSGESGAKYLRTIDDIRAALSDAGITPANGTVDQAFTDAMGLFWGNHFTAAVPELQKVLGLYPGHPLATQYLADAQAKAGSAEDVPLAAASPEGGGGSGGGFPMWAIGAIAGAVVLILVVVLVTRRRKPSVFPAAVTAMPPVSAVSLPPQEAPRPAAFESVPAPQMPAPAVTPAALAAAPAPAASGGLTAPAGSAASGNGSAGEDAQPHFCASCGHALVPEARFCPSCGTHVVD